MSEGLAFISFILLFVFLVMILFVFHISLQGRKCKETPLIQCFEDWTCPDGSKPVIEKGIKDIGTNCDLKNGTFDPTNCPFPANFTGAGINPCFGPNANC